MEKETEKKKFKMPDKKRLITAAILLTVLLAVSIPVLAWFSNRRGINTMTKIQSPAALNIGAGNKESCAYIDMSGIDVSDPDVTSKDFVFCVYSAQNGNYNIQLAHTTNIAFTYKIYKANVLGENGGSVSADVVYHSDLTQRDFYYTKSNEIIGDYINKDPSSKIATDSQHEATYSAYDKANVQINAEPLYWQNSAPITPNYVNGGFADYYILEVSWGPSEVKNDKETDMVYITAGMVS